MITIVWHGKEYQFQTKNLMYACCLLADQLGYKRAGGTYVFNELTKPVTTYYKEV